MNRIGKFLIVAIALAVILFLGYQVQLIRSIAVVGNRNLTSDEIIRQSGVHAGDSLLLTPESRIRDNLEKSRYIEYKRRGFDYRGTLTLTIRERLPAAYVNVLGIYYAIDTTGIVLDICGEELPEKTVGPVVNGLEMVGNGRAMVGSRLVVKNRAQLDHMQHMLEAMDATNLLGKAVSMSVQNENDLFLMTQEKTRIVLGEDTNLVLKLSIAAQVMAIREEEGDLKGSRIDVSSGKDAHFIPAVLPTVTPWVTPSPSPLPTDTPTAK